MTRYFILIISCTLLLPGCIQKDVHASKAEKAEIRAAVSQSFSGLVESVTSLDANHYYEFFDADKYTSLNEDGTVTHSFEEFQEAYDEQITFIKKYNSLAFSNVKITVIDRNTAILVNEYEAEVLLQSGDMVMASGGGLQVWSNTTGEWKLVSVSSSAKQ